MNIFSCQKAVLKQQLALQNQAMYVYVQNCDISDYLDFSRCTIIQRFNKEQVVNKLKNLKNVIHVVVNLIT